MVSWAAVNLFNNFEIISGRIKINYLRRTSTKAEIIMKQCYFTCKHGIRCSLCSYSFFVIFVGVFPVVNRLRLYLVYYHEPSD